jgi:hypothetical protein
MFNQAHQLETSVWAGQVIPRVGFDVLLGQLAPERTLLKKSQRRVRESNPIRAMFNVARFQRNVAQPCILEGKWPNERFVRIAQNYAVRVSEFVRKKASGRFWGSCFGESSPSAEGRQNRLIRLGRHHSRNALAIKIRVSYGSSGCTFTKSAPAKTVAVNRLPLTGCVIRVYDDAGNVIETHEHAGELHESMTPVSLDPYAAGAPICQDYLLALNLTNPVFVTHLLRKMA